MLELIVGVTGPRGRAAETSYNTFLHQSIETPGLEGIIPSVANRRHARNLGPLGASALNTLQPKLRLRSFDESQ
jgi:tRNA A37 threonylcarbamoyltransferase TsaD